MSKLVLNTITQIQRAVQELHDEVQKLKVTISMPAPEPVAEPVRRGRPRVEKTEPTDTEQ